MTERERAMKLVEQILDSPSDDPDNDLMMLARQLQRSEQRAQRLQMTEEAIVRIDRSLKRYDKEDIDNIVMALKVIGALEQFREGNRFYGWPEDS